MPVTKHCEHPCVTGHESADWERWPQLQFSQRCSDLCRHPSVTLCPMAFMPWEPQEAMARWPNASLSKAYSARFSKRFPGFMATSPWNSNETLSSKHVFLHYISWFSSNTWFFTSLGYYWPHQFFPMSFCARSRCMMRRLRRFSFFDRKAAM